MGTATKSGMEAAKTVSKRVVQKTANGNKITQVNKVTSVGRSKKDTTEPQQNNEANEMKRFIYHQKDVNRLQITLD